MLLPHGSAELHQLEHQQQFSFSNRLLFEQYIHLFMWWAAKGAETDAQPEYGFVLYMAYDYCFFCYPFARSNILALLLYIRALVSIV